MFSRNTFKTKTLAAPIVVNELAQLTRVHGYIMPTESIISTLLGAAAFLGHAVQDIASQAIRDGYDAAKSYLKKKFGAYPDAAHALEIATSKPESLTRKALLAEECDALDLERDAELARLIENLAALLPPSASPVRQNVRVTGDGNTVQVAGRDLIHTSKLIRRNAITPDERHLNVEQREHVRQLIGELAERLAGNSSTVNFGAVYRMLQRRFQVASYLLIPSNRYDEALSFLRQQRAIHRSRLRGRNPVAYQNDLYRAIFAGARELGWTGEQVYCFATEKLGLQTGVTSLKELGALQLKTLADSIRQQVQKHRDCDPLTSISKG